MEVATPLDHQMSHFCHPHPLHLCYLSQVLDYKTLLASSFAVPCSGCGEDIKANILRACFSCNYFLHIACAKSKYQIHHVSDPLHPLTLITKPTNYHGGAFICKACGKYGQHFFYHCGDCQLDLHMVCALLKPVVNHPCHGHTLELKVLQPHDQLTSSLTCNNCGQHGDQLWRYACSQCSFNCHIGCLNYERPSVQIASTSNHQQVNQSLNIPNSQSSKATASSSLMNMTKRMSGTTNSADQSNDNLGHQLGKQMLMGAAKGLGGVVVKGLFMGF